MCGPVNFDALHTCTARLAGLSAAGLAAYAIHRTRSLRRALRSLLATRGAGGRARASRRLATEDPDGRSGA